MNVKELSKALNGELICGDGEREVLDYYIGDLLSHVMGKLQADSAWLTVMNNINVAAVASLTDCSVIVLCDGTIPDEALEKKLKNLQINTIVTSHDLFSAAKQIILR